MASIAKPAPFVAPKFFPGSFQGRLPSVVPVLALLLIPVALASIWGIRKVEELERRQLASALKTVLVTTQTGLHLWARQVREDASTWANSEQLLAAVQVLLAVPRTPEHLRASPAFTRIRQILEPSQRRLGYQGFVVVAPDGTQLVADLDREVGAKGLQESDPATLSQALAGRVTLGLPFRSKIPVPTEGGDWYPGYPSMIVAAPIEDQEGLVVASLVFRLDPSANFTRVTRLARLGNTGETYAFDHDGRMITESRFGQQLREIGLIGPGDTGILSLELKDPGGNLLKGFRPQVSRSALPLTRMAKDALTLQQGSNLDGYRDYRGVAVLGTWLWDHELHLGLVTEIDKDEAYQPLWVARATILFMLAVVILGALTSSAVLARRAKVLADTVAREQDALAAKDEVLQVISHDLKNPLGVIALSSGLILNEEPKEVNLPSIHKHVRSIERAAERMAQLIDDLLQTSLIEAGRLRLELHRLDPLELLERAYDLQEPLAAQKSIHLSREVVGSLPAILGDEPRLLRVFTNLIGNAVKFTPRGGSIVLRVRKNQRSEVWFSIQDSGPGIPEDDLPHVFERYWQAVHTAKMGTGLGLFIAKGIIEAHGGRMWVESQLGQGATFHFVVPEASGLNARS